MTVKFLPVVNDELLLLSTRLPSAAVSSSSTSSSPSVSFTTTYTILKTTKGYRTISGKEL